MGEKKIKAENMTYVRALSSITVEPKFVCLIHNEAEQTLRVWSGEKFTARANKEQVAYAQKKQTTRFSGKHF